MQELQDVFVCVFFSYLKLKKAHLLRVEKLHEFYDLNAF